METRDFAVIVNEVVEKVFSVPAESKTAIVREVTGLSDIEVGTRYNPETQSFYCDLEDKPTAEI